jgi:hypothetical protein
MLLRCSARATEAGGLRFGLRGEKLQLGSRHGDDLHGELSRGAAGADPRFTPASCLEEGPGPPGPGGRAAWLCAAHWWVPQKEREETRNRPQRGIAGVFAHW